LLVTGRLVLLEAAVIRARTDPVAARHLLALLTHGCRTRDHFEQERAYLFGAGIPAEYLPTAAVKASAAACPRTTTPA
jgi:hypothetical protein